MNVLVLLGLVAALLAGLAFLATIERFMRDHVFGVAVILGLQVLNTFIDDGLPPIAPGGVTVTLGDLSFVLSIVAAAGIILRRRSFALPERLMLLLFGLIVWSILRGVATYGVTTAVNEGRTMLYTYGIAVYVSLAELDDTTRRRLGRVWLAAVWALIGIAVFRWAAFFAGIPPTGVFSRVEEPGSLRVIDSRTTLMIVAAVLLVAPRWLQGLARPHEKLLAVVGSFAVLLLQHRTLYIVFFAAALFFALENPRIGGRVVAALAGLATVAVMLFVAFAPQDTSDIEGVAQSPIESQTLEWRVEGWRLLLQDQGVSTGGVFVGRPSGAGWDRTIGYSDVTANPHNWFLQDYLRLGLLGAGTHLFALALGWYHLRRSPVGADARDLLTPPVARTWIVAYLMFGMLWSMNVAYGVVLGLVCARWTTARGTSDAAAEAAARAAWGWDEPDESTAAFDWDETASVVDATGWDGTGLDATGLDATGFDHTGFDATGFDATGFDATGFDNTGFDNTGFDHTGFDSDDGDVTGWDSAGWGSAGWDSVGWDSAEWDASGSEPDDLATGDDRRGARGADAPARRGPRGAFGGPARDRRGPPGGGATTTPRGPGGRR